MMKKTDSTIVSGLRSVGALWDSAGMLVVFLAVFLACTLLVENFFTWGNMENVAMRVSMLGMIACTMLFCLASGDFDLSVGSVVACGGVVSALTVGYTGSAILGILAGLGAGAVVGLLNGVVIAKFRINALITTLASMQIVRGIAQLLTRGSSANVANEDFFILGQARPLGVPTTVWVPLACFVFFGWLLWGTTYGRNTLAIGGNREAARLAGIAVDRIKITIFTAQGLMAGLAGVFTTSQNELCHPTTTGDGLELKVISACVLGGVSLTGGVGSIVCVIAGVLIMGTVQNAMALRQIDPFYQKIVTGAILLGAVLFDRYKQWRKSKAL